MALFALTGQTAAYSQTDADLKLLDKARALYFTGPAPKSVSCDAEIDWDDFFKRMNAPQDDATKARLEKLKQIKISITTRGAADTTVTVTGAEPASMSSGIEQQLRGFFQMYWSEAYGDLLAKKGDVFQLSTNDDGYVEHTKSGMMDVAVSLNKSFLITQVVLQSPQLSATVKPGFDAGSDGLLRLRKVDQVAEMGSSKLAVVISFSSKLAVVISFDYQKVGAYDFPHLVEMSIPGSYTFHYALSACKADSDSATGAATISK